MELTDRQELLLREAARAFEDMRDPFSLDFLRKHTVGFEEVQWLSTMIAVMIRANLP